LSRAALGDVLAELVGYLFVFAIVGRLRGVHAGSPGDLCPPVAYVSHDVSSCHYHIGACVRSVHVVHSVVSTCNDRLVLHLKHRQIGPKQQWFTWENLQARLYHSPTWARRCRIRRHPWRLMAVRQILAERTGRRHRRPTRECGAGPMTGAAIGGTLDDADDDTPTMPTAASWRPSPPAESRSSRERWCPLKQDQERSHAHPGAGCVC